MHAYSLDLRERVVRAVDRGEWTQKQVAERFGVSTAWIKKLLRQRQKTGSIAPRPHGGGRRPKYEGRVLKRLEQELRKQPDATLEELRDRTCPEASLMAVFRALKRLGSRRKKNRSAPLSRTVRTLPKSGGPG
jgi:transposase